MDAAGRADHAELARRLAGESGRPVAFLAFDLLHLDGPSLLSQPLVRRRESLRRVLRPGDEVVAVPAIATEGVALFEAAVAQGIAGILARQRASPYLPGVRSRLWRFVAATRGDRRGAAAARTTKRSRGAGAAAAPVLALISRLPARGLRHAGPAAPAPWPMLPAPNAAATNALNPGRWPYSSTPAAYIRVATTATTRSPRPATRSTGTISHGWTADDHHPRQHDERAERRHERGERDDGPLAPPSATIGRQVAAHRDEAQRQ